MSMTVGLTKTALIAQSNNIVKTLTWLRHSRTCTLLWNDQTSDNNQIQAWSAGTYDELINP